MKELRRYTSIPSLIDIIHNQALTLLDPGTWTDKNDVYAMNQYRTHSPKKIKTLLALCFTEAEETFHHWNVFAGNSNGVCIVFDKDALIACIEERENCRHGSVTYLKSNEFQFDKLTIEELPFIKRNGYDDEMEYRVVYEDSLDHRCLAGIPINISCINKIVFPPQIPSALLSSFSEVILRMENVRDYDIAIDRSQLTDDILWQCMIDGIAQPDIKPHERFYMRLLEGL